MPRRYELTDPQYQRLTPLLPGNGRRGGQWNDHRQVLNGMLWRLQTGAPWCDLPERYGCGKPFMTASTAGVTTAPCGVSPKFCL